MTNPNIHSSFKKKKPLNKIEIEHCYLNMIPIYIHKNSRIMIYEKPLKAFHEKPTSK